MQNSKLLYPNRELNEIGDNDEDMEEGQNEVNEKIETRKVTKTNALNMASLVNQCDNPDVNCDAEFADKLADLLANSNTSTFLLPQMSKLRNIHQELRKNVKNRISNELRKPPVINTEDNSTGNIIDELEQDNDDAQDFDENSEFIEKEPKLGEYWLIKHGNNSLYAIIAEENPIGVKYFESMKGVYHRLIDKMYDVYMGDLCEKVAPPEPIVGKTRTFYHFKK